MGKAMPAQHPSVVLRSQFNLVRALLAVAMIAIVGLSIAVVIVANEEDQVSGTNAARPAQSIRYGDFNPATGRPESAPLPQREHPLQSRIGSTRYDGGPEEGTRAVVPAQAPAIRPGGGGAVEGTSSGVKDYSMNAATGDTGSGAAQKSLNGPGARTR